MRFLPGLGRVGFSGPCRVSTETCRLSSASPRAISERPLTSVLNSSDDKWSTMITMSMSCTAQIELAARCDPTAEILRRLGSHNLPIAGSSRPFQSVIADLCFAFIKFRPNSFCANVVVTSTVWRARRARPSLMRRARVIEAAKDRPPGRRGPVPRASEAATAASIAVTAEA